MLENCRAFTMPFTFFILFLLFSIKSVESARQTKADYGENCTEVKSCNGDQFLECDSSTWKCRCKNENQTVFDREDKMCKIRANEVCAQTNDNDTQQCVAHAKCVHDLNSKTLHCKCPYYSMVSRGECFSGFQGPCSGTFGLPCDTQSFMECTPTIRAQDLCLCSQDKDIGYDAIKKSCVLLEGAKCGEQESESYKPPCTEYTTCKSTGCVCRTGSQGLMGRKCFADYREPCGGLDEAKCRPGAYMTCKDGECSCKGERQSTLYDRVHGECQLSWGSNCTIGGQSCLSRQTCSAERGSCVCAPGFSPNKLKECFLPFGASCKDPTLTHLCDPSSFLRCSQYSPSTFKCDCGDLLLEDGICKLKAHMKCSTWIQNQPECIKNSVCKEVNETEICECIEPFIKDKESSLCVEKANDISTCDPSVPGSCGSDQVQKCPGGRCACEDPKNMEFVEKTGSCVMKLNSPCKIGSRNVQCAEMLVCNSRGYCACDVEAGYILNDVGKCVKPYGAECRTHDIPEGFCDTSSYHTCKYERCRCDASHNEKEGRNDLSASCWGNAGALCKTDANCDMEKHLICDLAKGECKHSTGFRIPCHLGVASFLAIVALTCKHFAV